MPPRGPGWHRPADSRQSFDHAWHLLDRGIVDLTLGPDPDHRYLGQYKAGRDEVVRKLVVAMAHRPLAGAEDLSVAGDS